MKDGKNVILCVDDDQDLLDSMRIILEDAGFIVEEAGTAMEGVARFKELEPDLVVVDLMMEEVDAGTSFVKEIRAIGSKTPIFMLSSVGDSLNLNTDYSALGLSGLLQKPINPETLVKSLKSKLG